MSFDIPVHRLTWSPQEDAANPAETCAKFSQVSLSGLEKIAAAGLPMREVLRAVDKIKSCGRPLARVQSFSIGDVPLRAELSRTFVKVTPA